MDVNNLEREKRECNVTVNGVQTLTSEDKKLIIRSDIEFLVGKCGISGD